MERGGRAKRRRRTPNQFLIAIGRGCSYDQPVFHLPVMKTRLFIALFVAGLLLPGLPAWADETNTVAAESKMVFERINDKIRAGKMAESDFAEDIKDYDAILARHAGENPEELARVLHFKAVLYFQVLRDIPKARETFLQIQRDFPQTKSGAAVTNILKDLEAEEAFAKKMEAARKINAALVPGVTFPDFEEKDIAGNPLSIANYKGKVVLVDFWATWCPPCLMDMPFVHHAYEKYHDRGFEIIGISLDEDQATLAAFLKQKKITWPQYFDGLRFENKLAVKYGVVQIPTTFLLDRQGKIIGTDLHQEEIEKAVAKAMETK
jgi:thiol-disulfide isomerase/thioredoxin